MAQPFRVFHQREHLTTRIRNILRDYPRGTLPLREFVQNADDAGAKRFCVLLDTDTSVKAGELAQEKVHDGFLSPLMKEFDQSRDSLFIFNDATFSERDFQSITSLGNSMKQADQTKVGKYGLGFNVAYHYSDVISFVSRNQLVVFDPHQRHLPDQLPGLRADFTSDSFRGNYPQQLDGFSRAAVALGRPFCNDGSFDGTLFRLPLRTEQEAEASEISGAYIGRQEMLDVLQEFAQSAGELLVFLKHVEHIDVLIRRTTPEGVRVERVGQAQITNADADLRRHRCLLEHLCVPSATYSMAIKQAVQGRPDETQTWLVHARVHSSPAAEPLALALRERPFLGAALQLDSQAPHAELSAEGRPFCFLPLPLRTGLPVHLNAFFALSSNRRALWSGDNEAGGGEGVVREQWNAMLLSEALPMAYGALLSALSRRPEATPALVYKFWPSLEAVSSSFRPVAAGLVARVLGAVDAGGVPLPLLFDTAGARWCAAGGGSDLLFETRGSRARCGPAVREELVAVGVGIVDPPAHVRAAIRTARQQQQQQAGGDAGATTVPAGERGAGEEGEGGGEERGLETLTARGVVRRLAGRALGRGAGVQLLCLFWEPAAQASELVQSAHPAAAYALGADAGDRGRGERAGGEEGSGARGEGVTVEALEALVGSGCACVPVMGGGVRCIGRPSGWVASAGTGRRAGCGGGGEEAGGGGGALILSDDQWRPLLQGTQHGIVELRAEEGEGGGDGGRWWELAGRVLRALCDAGETNIRRLAPRDVAQHLPRLLPPHWQGHGLVVLRQDRPDALSGPVPPPLRPKALAALRTQAAAVDAASAAAVERWVPPLALLWRFLEHSCLHAAPDAPPRPHLRSVADYREAASGAYAREVVALFDSWPIVPVASGAVLSCPEARSLGVISAGELPEAEKALMIACHVHMTPLHNTLVSALLFASRGDSCRALALAFESGPALNAVPRPTRLRLRRQILAWKAEADAAAVNEDGERTCEDTCREGAAAAAAAPSCMLFQVSHVRRLPVFSTVDGDVRPLTKDLFATPAPNGRDPYERESQWEALLGGITLAGANSSSMPRTGGSLGAKILSYQDSDAREILAMANQPRPLDEFELLARLCSNNGELLAHLTPPVWMEVLRACSRVKPWKKARTPRVLQLFEAHRVIDAGDGTHLPSEALDTSDALLMACVTGTSVLASTAKTHVVLPPAYAEPGILAVLRHMGLVTIASAEGFLLAARAVAERGDLDLGFELLGQLLRLHQDPRTLPWPPGTYDRLAATPFVPCIEHRSTDPWPSHGGLPEYILPVTLRAQRQGGGGSQRAGRQRQAEGRGDTRAAAEEAAMEAEDAELEFAQEQVEEAAAYLAEAPCAPSAAPTWALRRVGEGVLYAAAWTAYTVCPVLPAECDGMPALLLQRLHVAHPPSAKKVARHLLNLAAAWHRSPVPPAELPDVTPARQAVVQLCLADLHVLRQQLSPGCAQSLHTARFVVLDDGSVVRPADILFELSSADTDLAEDVRAPPPYLEPYHALFHRISEQSSAATVSLPPPPVVVDAEAPAPTLELLVAEFDRKALADVCMRLAPGRFLFLHRLLLGLASPVLRALFSSPMAAAAARSDDPEFLAAAGGRWCVEAPEWATPEGVRDFMRYLYSGALPACLGDAGPPTQERVTGVIEQLRLAGFYDSRHLHQSCEAFLAHTEGVAALTNLLDLLQLADDAHALQLRAHVMHRAREAAHIMQALPEWEALPEATRAEIRGRGSAKSTRKTSDSAPQSA